MSNTRRFPLLSAGALVLLCLLPVPPGAVCAERSRPNIIYFMSDELAYYELSCMGHPQLRTPNIDRMASEGVRFTQGLAGSSVCAPTRCCLMTGRHSGHSSVRKNGGGTPLRAEEETIASLLKPLGYATGGFGKWGCGGRGSTGVPDKHGFDVFLGYYDQVHAHSYYPPYIIRNSEELILPGNSGGRSGETYSHYVIMDAARKFLRENRKRPFFLYLPVTPPHGMFDIPDSDPGWQLFKDKPWPEEAKRYAAMVSMVDRNVGDILSMLKELDLDERTIVFFCGDNGGQDRFRSADHPRGFFGPNVDPKTGVAFRGSKGNLYEGGLRIPMIVRWPGKISPGRVSDFLWYFPDVLPTVAEITGASPPEGIDGISIVPELLGEDKAGRKQEQHEFLYWELGRQTAVRMGDWKAIQPRPNAPWELYDVRRDPGEQDDLADRQPEVIARMKKIATREHEPAREGTFKDTAKHEKDRRAKWGDTRKEPTANVMPSGGLLPRKGWKIARVSSESAFNGRLARYAIDGDPRTLWHSKWRDGAVGHPHELVLDLGAEHTIRGIRYLARQDAGWNGTIKECELYVGDSPDSFGKPVAKATLKKTKDAQDVKCPEMRGRYVLLRALSEIQGGAWASVAELGVIGE